MKQQQKKPHRRESSTVDRTLSLRIPYQLSPGLNGIVSVALVALCVVAGLLYILPMEEFAAGLGFPLEESWIALTYAKNLREFGAYSFYATDMIASGSTSPLYVFIAALFGFLFSSEFTLSFFLGVGSFAIVALFVYRLAKELFQTEHWLALVVTLLFVLTPRIHSASVSGMPTMFFTALVVAAAYYFIVRKPIHFFVLTGLALWTRPDALVLLIAMGLHVLVQRFGSRDSVSDWNGWLMNKRGLLIGIVAFVVLLAGYASFNLALSGTVFPNSVHARLAFFSEVPSEFFAEATFGYYATSLGAILVFPFLIGVVFFVLDVVKRRSNAMAFAFLFTLGPVATYAVFLPFLFNDGRYLTPTTPFYILCAVWSVRRVFERLLTAIPIKLMRTTGNTVSLILFGVAVLLALIGWKEKRTDHYKAVTYVNDRQVAAAKWINVQTPPDATIATHVVGPIGYYGERKIIDLFGVVSPEVVPLIGNLAALELHLATSNVQFIATLRERLEVVNANPVFASNEQRPEIMEVIPYVPKKVHILPQNASQLNTQAARLLQSNYPREAMQLLQQSYELDRNSVRTNTLLGLCFLALSDTNNAIAFLSQAITIQQDYAPAMVPLGDMYINRKEYGAATGLFKQALLIKPDFKLAKRSLERVEDLIYQDSLYREGYRPIVVGKQ